MSDEVAAVTRSGAASPVEPLAIVGIGCRFPGSAVDPASFWGLLESGRDAICRIPPDRLSIARHYDPTGSLPGKIYAERGGFVDGVGEFDAAFFGISPREASRMDPQQRLLLEVAWEALEDAGQPIEAVSGTEVGVFVGVSCQDYYEIQTGPAARTAIDAHTATGGAISIVANRISHALDLRGPSLSVDTACSSSLVALHLACRSVWNDEVPMALAGGVNLILTAPFFICLSKLAMISPEGRCRAFDAGANGFVRGEGSGVVVVKRLSQALADRDRIYALVRGTAISQDGRTTGITVPRREAQERAVRAACRAAGVAPHRIQYVEAHGTGTPVGDPIEAGALGGVLGGNRSGGPCRIGSVKTNIGHLEPAAGIAGLIKTALALHHARIPASLHFERPNPEIDFAELQLAVQRRCEPWPGDPGDRWAGVNSFGFGGTNAHAILSSAPAQRETEPNRRSAPALAPLTLSARDPAALRQMAGQVADLLERGAERPTLADLAYTATTRRSHHPHRLATRADSGERVAERLRAFALGEAPAGLVTGRAQGTAEHRPVFVFSGQGPQWWAMGRGLLAAEPVFRRTVETVDRVLQGEVGWSLLDEMAASEKDSRIGRTHVLQPALFGVQAGLSDLWRSWGLEPGAVIGHSMGEVAACYAAGVLTLEDATRVIAQRGRVQEKSSGSGKMLAAALPAEAAEELVAAFPDRLWLAGVHSPEAVTLAGEPEVIDRVHAGLETEGVFSRVLRVACACHSPHMDPYREELLAAIGSLPTAAGRVPVYSTVTGGILAGEELGAHYWWRNFRQPVRFRDAVDRALGDGFRSFIEIGPHPVLLPYLGECARQQGAPAVAVPSLKRGDDELDTLMGSLAALYCAGAAPRWEAFQHPAARFRPLPAYPWQRQRHWHETGSSRDDRLGPATHPLLGRRIDSPRPTWQNELDGAVAPFLLDHSVERSLVVPGVAHVTMALLALEREEGDRPCAAERVSFESALILPEEGALTTQLILEQDRRSFELYSRQPAEDAPWVRHSHGALRLLEPSPEAPPPVALDEIRERCRTTASQDEFYERAWERGIELGEAFRGVRRLWWRAGEILGELRVPESLEPELPLYRLHPAILDACWQLSLTLLGEERPGLHLPVQVASVRIHGAAAHGPLFGWGRVVDRGRSTVDLDLLLLDAQGHTLAEARALQFRRVAAQARTGAPRELEHCFYTPRWEEASRRDGARPPLEPDALPAPAELAGELVPMAGQLFERFRRQRFYQELQPGIDRYCAGMALVALRSLEGSDSLRGPIEPRELAERLGVAPRHRRLLGRLMEILGQDQLYDDQRGLAAAPAGEPRELWRRLSRDFPAYHAELDLLRRAAEALPEVLAGRRDPLESIFPGGSFTTTEHLYQDAPTSRLYNRLLQAALSRAVERFPGRRTLQILEIGGGTGGTTAYLTRELPAARARYRFTDVSRKFLDHAAAKFARRAGVDYGLLDIESDPLEQGYPEAGFDIVVASDVLHATRDLRRTLTHVERLLAPNGMLLLLEVTQRPRWGDLIFGQLDGWWRFEDRKLRPDHPLLPSARWRELLAAGGFSAVEAVSEPVAGGGFRSLLIARRSPATEPSAAAISAPTPEPRSWLVLGDARPLTRELLARLRDQGDRVLLAQLADGSEPLEAAAQIVEPGDESAVTGLLHRWLESTEGPRGVVHLWGLAEVDGAEDPMGLPLDLGTRPLLHLVRQLSGESSPGDFRLAVVTRGAQDAADDQAEVRPHQAPMWGLLRVARNELPEIRFQAIDLDPAAAAGEKTEAAELADELRHAGEEEVALRRERRRIRRLRPDPDLGVVRLPSASLEAWPAGFAAVRGNGDRAYESGVALHESERPAPGPGEVEIAVDALGLSAPENGSSDAPEAVALGCAGRVARLGSGVQAFAVGQRVIAAGPQPLASSIVAPAEALVAQPEELSPEEAATLPSFLLAARALERWHAGGGGSLLVQGGGDGVGLAALQLSTRDGAPVIVSDAGPERLDYLASLGVASVVDPASPRYDQEIRQLTGGRGVDLMVDVTGRGNGSGAGRPEARGAGRMVTVDRSGWLATPGADTIERMVQVVGCLARGELRPLPHRTFSIDDLEPALDYCRSRDRIGDVVLAVDGEPIAVRRDGLGRQLRADRTYLIVGGLGGFGLRIAGWLADRGCRHLTLMGRSGAGNPEAREAVESLRARGVQVTVEAADVSDPTTVDRVIASIQTGGPPIAGVIHAAMVLDDALLASLTDQRLRSVLKPKVAGAWNLHKSLERAPLDFFVLFSSIAGTLGREGQANYVAGNAFLDALAHHRRRLGLPASSISWGRLGEIGYVADSGLGPTLDRQGIEVLSADEALAALGLCLVDPRPEITITRIDWRRWAGAEAWPATSSFLREVVPREPASSCDGSGATRSGNEDSGRPVGSVLAAAAGSVLGIPPDRLEPDRPLTDLGLDSLMAVELSARIRDQLGVDLPVLKLLQHPSLNRLERMVSGEAAERRPGGEPQNAAAAVTSPSAIGSRILDLVGELPPKPERQIDRQKLAELSPSQRRWRAAMRWLLRPLVRVEQIEGADRVPATGGVILAGNHPSVLDPFLVFCWLPRRMCFFATWWLRGLPGVRQLLDRLADPIYRVLGEGDPEAIDEAAKVLGAGGAVLIAPEGDLGKDGLLRAKIGAAYIASRAQAPLMSFVMFGHQRPWRSWLRLRRVRVRFRFGRVWEPPPPGASAAELIDYTQRYMRDMAALLPPELRGAYRETKDRGA